MTNYQSDKKQFKKVYAVMCHPKMFVISATYPNLLEF